jgi:ATP synthase protein I
MRLYFRAVRWILAVQIMVASAIIMVALLMGGISDARSALFGGLTAFLPNMYFAAKFGFSDPDRTARQVVRAFYLGETIKLSLTAVMFFIVFQLPDIRFMPLFTAYGAVLAVFWFALLVRGKDS